MDLAEKSELMARLRAEGRWEDATKFREEIRLKAKKDGCSRDEAKSRAWAEMADAYPPLSDRQIALLPAIEWFCMADFPIDSMRKESNPGEIPYQSVWVGTCISIALLQAKQHSCDTWFSIAEQIFTKLNTDPTNDELRSICMHTLASPYAFLMEVTVPSFMRLLGPENELPPEDQAAVDALVQTIRKMTPENVAETLTVRFG